jgi:DNA-binding transcriptional MocR family regulator
MRIADRPAAALAARAGLHVLPLSRYGVGAGRYNGWLLGYAALTERRIVRGVERLRAVLDAYPNVSTHGTRKLAVSPNSSAPAKHPG